MRKVLVLMGDGINSENELELAFKREGANTFKLHVNELLKYPAKLMDYDLLAIPGGFSFGDEIRSGKILAEKMRDVLSESLYRFRQKEGRIIGICNGFQVLSQLGAFDKNFEERSFTLAENSHHQFIDLWTALSVSKSHSAWTQGLQGKIFLPIRHREGRIVPRNQEVSFHKALSYESDVNGSFQNVAGVFDDSGNVFGLMPHPEVATMSFLHPFQEGARENALKVRQIFINGLR